MEQGCQDIRTNPTRKMGQRKMKDRDYYNCVFPEKRPRNIWVVTDIMNGHKIGEVAAMSEAEARIKVSQHVMVPFKLSHIEE